MSIVKPTKWADISDNNPAVSISELARKKYAALALRVTGGYGGGSDVYMDAHYKARQKQLNRTDMAQIVYGFPVSDAAVPLDRQIDRFVNGVIGGFDNKMPAIDYELYAPSHALTVSPGELRYYTRGIFHQIGEMPYFMYAGLDFWNSAPDTGDADRFPRQLKQWAPKYVTIDPLRANPIRFYHRYVRQMLWWRRYAKRDDKRTPEAAQIGIFYEAGGALDVNMSRVSGTKLKEWAHTKGV